MSILSIDLGFSSVKVKADHTEFSYPTLVVIPQHKNVSEDGAKIHEYNGVNYVVGDVTVTGADQYQRSFDFLLKYAPVLVAHAVKESGLHPASLTEIRIGIPYEDYRQRKAEMVEILEDFTVSGVRYHYEITCLPQGVGAFLEYEATADAKKILNSYLIDIGFNTVILIRVINGEAKKGGSQQLDRYGMSGAMKYIQDQIEAEFGNTPSVVKTCQAFRDRSYSYRGKELKNFGEICDTAVKLHLEKMLSEVCDTRSDEFDQVHQLIISGGGAYYVTHDLIPARYRMMTEIVDPSTRPEFANVRGMHRI